MEVAIAGVVGFVLGWLLGTLSRKRSATDVTGEQPNGSPLRRPSRRQRRILDMLPDDPPRPTIDDLIAEEAAELGVTAIATDPRIPLTVRLQVFRRDVLPGEGPPADSVEFIVLRDGSSPIDASNVRLVPRRVDDDG